MDMFINRNIIAFNKKFGKYIDISPGDPLYKKTGRTFDYFLCPSQPQELQYVKSQIHFDDDSGIIADIDLAINVFENLGGSIVLITALPSGVYMCQFKYKEQSGVVSSETISGVIFSAILGVKL